MKRAAAVAGMGILFYLGIGLTWSLFAALAGLTFEQERAGRSGSSSLRSWRRGRGPGRPSRSS
jgi:hypothetical protein